jgi:hypothetical protein
MLEAGEDPLYVARRMVRFASEDVGLADPAALTVAIAAKDAVHFIGMPEGTDALAQAAIYLATAPKSNAVTVAYGEARQDIRAGRTGSVPLAIRNAPTPLMKDLGYGAGYQYAHDLPEGVADMECLPEDLRGRKYYQPSDRGFEKTIRERMTWWEEAQGAGRGLHGTDPQRRQAVQGLEPSGAPQGRCARASPLLESRGAGRPVGPRSRPEARDQRPTRRSPRPAGVRRRRSPGCPRRRTQRAGTRPLAA